MPSRLGCSATTQSGSNITCSQANLSTRHPRISVRCSAPAVPDQRRAVAVVREALCLEDDPMLAVGRSRPGRRSASSRISTWGSKPGSGPRSGSPAAPTRARSRPGRRLPGHPHGSLPARPAQRLRRGDQVVGGDQPRRSAESASVSAWANGRSGAVHDVRSGVVTQPWMSIRQVGPVEDTPPRPASPAAADVTWTWGVGCRSSMPQQTAALSWEATPPSRAADRLGSGALGST